MYANDVLTALLAIAKSRCKFGTLRARSALGRLYALVTVNVRLTLKVQAPMYYRDADAIVLAFDMTNRQSFDDLQRWVNGTLRFNLCSARLTMTPKRNFRHGQYRILCVHSPLFYSFIDLATQRFILSPQRLIWPTCALCRQRKPRHLQPGTRRHTARCLQRRERVRVLLCFHILLMFYVRIGTQELFNVICRSLIQRSKAKEEQPKVELTPTNETTQANDGCC